MRSSDRSVPDSRKARCGDDHVGFKSKRGRLAASVHRLLPNNFNDYLSPARQIIRQDPVGFSLILVLVCCGGLVIALLVNQASKKSMRPKSVTVVAPFEPLPKDYASIQAEKEVAALVANKDALTGDLWRLSPKAQEIFFDGVVWDVKWGAKDYCKQQLYTSLKRNGDDQNLYKILRYNTRFPYSKLEELGR